MRKYIAVVMALLLVFALAAPAGWAEADVKVVTGWGATTFNDQTGITSYSEQISWQEIEKRLGVRVDWTTVSGADKDAKFGLAMADSGNLPDFFVDMNPLILEEYGRLGALIDLSEYITPELMPNLCALIEADPSIRASITSADGSIYFFPRIMDGSTRYWSGMFIREDFLEMAGKEMPTTTDEFYEAMVAIKENVEGVEYPISMNMDSLKAFINCWGVGAGATGTFSTGNYYIKDGAVAFGPNTDETREAMIWLRKLYVEGLINPEWNALDGTTIRSNIITGTAAVCEGSFAGIMTTYNNLFLADGKEAVLTWLPILVGPTGAQSRQGHHMSIDLQTASAISSTCTDVESLIKVIDYLYGEEGRELFYWGIEGQTFNRDAEGNRVFVEEGLNSEIGVGTWAANYIGNASMYASAMLPDFYRSTLSAEAGEGNIYYTETNDPVDIALPALRYTEEEITEVNTIVANITDYVNEWFALFLNGNRDINNDADWAEYVAGFEGLRLEEVMGYMNDAYLRWQAAAK